MATTAVSYHGASGSIGIGKENAYGTAVARAVWRPIIACSFLHDLDLKTRPNTRTGAASFNKYGSTYTSRAFWGGRLSLEATFDNLGMLFEQAIGSVSTQNDTPSAGYYTHTFVRSLTFNKGLTFELNRGALDGSKELFAGGKISSMTLTAEAGGLLLVDFDCFGRWDPATETAPRTDTAASPTFGTDEYCVTSDLGSVITWNSTTVKAKRIVTTVNNGLQDWRQFVGSITSDEPIRNGEESITMEATVEVNDVKWAEFVSRAQGDLTQNYTLGTRALNQTLHNAQLIKVSDPYPNDVGVLMSTLTWRAFSDGTDEGYKLVAVNQESSAVGNG